MSAATVAEPLHAELIEGLRRSGKPVGVLGAGPSGLLAAHAARLAGFDVMLLDRFAQRPPNQQGVYLHKPIPDITSDTPDGHVEFTFKGSASVYAQKVYAGTEAAGDASSWERFLGAPQPAWQFNESVRRLWAKYRRHTIHCEVNRSEVNQLRARFGLIISTIPAMFLCDGSHDFDAAHAWIGNGLPLGVVLPSANAYLYNGEINDRWTRCGRLFGHSWTEFNSHTPGAVAGQKPIGNNCDCLPEIVRAGRFGQWRRGVLLTDVFAQVAELCGAPS